MEIDFKDILKNIDFRIDSGFWTMRILYNTSLKYVPIGQVIDKSQYGISVAMNENNEGIPIYRMNEIHQMLCDNQASKFAVVSPKDKMAFLLHDKDVLFNRTNSYDFVGRTGIYYKDKSDAIFASYLVRFITNDLVQPEYLAAFLNCKFGIQEIRKHARQSINQTNVNPEEVKNIKIPILKNLQNHIVNNFKKANLLRNNAEKDYYTAENILLQYLEMSSDYKYQNKSFCIKSFKNSFLKTGRLDAEYYQPKYDNYRQQLKTTDTVQSICHLHDKNYKPQKGNIYQYIELANVGACGSINNVEQIVGEQLPSRARRQVKMGQIIIASVEGSLQSCALIGEEYNNALCSTGFYVLDSDIINPETLLVLFKSKPIQALLKQRCSGTILTAIAKDELLSMPFPRVEPIIQKEIANKIQQSFALKKYSSRLLEMAKSAVEIAIEKGEEEAIAYINKHTNEVIKEENSSLTVMNKAAECIEKYTIK